MVESCPNCGAPLDVKDTSQARMKYCQFCGTQIDLETEDHRVLHAYDQKPSPPKSSLQLGSEGNINGIVYQVVGRIRYRDTRDYSWWDEWLLLSENGQYLWLQEDDWDFTLMHKYTPSQPVDPNTVGEYLDIDGNHLEVEDNSEAVIQFFEGELTWKAEVGENVNYIDAWKGEDTLYSIEWTNREIMFFLGKDIPAKSIYEAFHLGAPPAEAFEEDDGEGGGKDAPMGGMVSRMMKGPAFGQGLTFGIIIIALAIILGMFGVNIPSGGEKAGKAGAYVLGPYKFSKKGVYRVDTRLGGLNNRSQYVEFEVLDDKKETIYGFDADFYHESGYDGGEHYTESKTSKDVVLLIEDPGTYYIRVTPEKGTKGVVRPSVKVKEGVFHTMPLWVAGLFILAYPGLVLLIYMMSQSSDD